MFAFGVGLQRRRALTTAIERVARANGSPITWPKLKLFFLRESIMMGFRSDGEWSDPYEGIGGRDRRFELFGRTTARVDRFERRVR